MIIDSCWIAALFVLTQVWGVVPEPTEQERLQWALHLYDWEPSARQTQAAATQLEEADLSSGRTQAFAGRLGATALFT